MKSKKRHGCLTSIIIFAAICIIIGFFVNKGVNDMEKHPEKYDDSIAAKYIDIGADEGKQIDKVLIQCGINEVNSLNHDELLDNAHTDGETGYRISVSDSIKNIILYLNADKSVYVLKYNDYDLYANGAAVATLDDYTVSKDELDKYKNLCQEKIKELLKSPSTAKFPNYTDWGWKQEKNLFYVQGYVDAQNGFGAEIRSQFQFRIDMDTDTIQSLIFDGQEVIK